MDDNKQKYYKMFNAVTEIIDELKKVRQKTEEMFISQEKCRADENKSESSVNK